MKNVIRTRRAYCAPEIDLTDDPVPMLTCVGISGHIESDEEGEVEISPIFSTVAEVVDWALQRSDILILRVSEDGGSPLYWRGPGKIPGDAVALDQDQAERDYAEFVSRFPQPLS